MSSKSSRVLRQGLTGWLALGTALVLLSSAGCFESTTDAESTGSTTTSATIPALTEIQSKVGLDNGQLTALKPAHDRWQQAERSRLNGGVAGDTSPVLEFVAESASVLNREQLRQLITLLGQHQQARFAALGGGERPGPGRPGPGGPGHFGGRRGHPGPGMPGGDPFADLGLTEEQRLALREAMETMHTTMLALHEQLASGALTPEQFEQAVAEARATHQAAVQSILTAEQYAQLQAAQRDRMIEHLQAMLADFDDRAARRLDILDRILGLEDQQVTAIQDVLNGSKSALETVLAGLQSGELSLEDARSALDQNRDDTESAIRAQLTEEQAAIFDALRSLRPHRRGPAA